MKIVDAEYLGERGEYRYWQFKVVDGEKVFRIGASLLRTFWSLCDQVRLSLSVFTLAIALSACGADPGPDHDPAIVNVPIRGPVPIDVATDCSPKVAQCT